jgi:hypothetical protein
MKKGLQTKVLHDPDPEIISLGVNDIMMKDQNELLLWLQ